MKLEGSGPAPRELPGLKSTTSLLDFRTVLNCSIDSTQSKTLRSSKSFPDCSELNNRKDYNRFVGTLLVTEVKATPKSTWTRSLEQIEGLLESVCSEDNESADNAFVLPASNAKPVSPDEIVILMDSSRKSLIYSENL